MNNDIKYFLLDVVNDIRNKKGFKKLNQLNNSDVLTDDLGLDSLDLAELTVRVQDEFNVDIYENGIVNRVDEVIAEIKGD